MSPIFRTLRRGLVLLVVAGAMAVTAAAPADAGGRHRGHGGSDVFFSFGFGGYYDPYPYGYAPYPYPPVYAYPPAYAYEPAYDPYYGSPYPQSAPYRANAGSYCREFQTTIVVDGRPQNAFGTACQQPDGSWQVVN